MKKILALLMTFVMALSLFAVPMTVSAAADDELAVTDQQLDLLAHLGAIGKDYVKKYPNNEMSRGGAAYYFVNFSPEIKAAPAASAFEAIYKDITSEYQYYRQVKAVKDAGVMVGYPDGTFRPGQGITAREAAKVFLYTIGYKEYIAVFGLDKAIQTSNIMDGLEGADVLHVHEFARMMWNALHAPAIEMTNVSTNGAEFEIDEMYLGLDKLHNITYARGVVDGVPGTKLQKPDQSLNENEVYIGGEKFVYNQGSKFGTAREFLGYSVDFYFKEYSSGVKEAVYIRKSDKNEELVLSSDDIEDYSNFVYSYWVGNKEKKATITDSTDVIFNDVAYPAYTDEDAIPDYGTVTLISNDGKKGYEVVKIENYEFFLVNNVDLNSNIFYDVNEGVKLDLSKADDFRITWDGDEWPIDRIIYGDFLIVKRTSPDSGYYYAEIDVRKDARPVTKVESFNFNDNTLKGGGLEYKLWSGIVNDEESKAALVNGALVTLYFSKDGTVVRVEKGTGSNAIYGYLITVANDGILNENVMFRLVDNQAKVDVYDMGKTIKIDGYSYKTFDEISNILASAAASYETAEGEVLNPDNMNSRFYNPDFPYAQPVKYELTEAGILKSLDTIFVNRDAADEEQLSLDAVATVDLTMRNQNHTLYNGTQMVVTIGSSTTKLQIPFKDRNDEENYSVLTWGDGEIMGKELSFNLDERIYIPEAHYHFESTSTAGNIKGTVRPVIVKEKLIELNNEGDTVYTLKCYSQKTEVTYTIKEQDATDIETGDMIRVELNEDNSIKEGRIEKIFDASEGKFVSNSNLGENGKFYNLRPEYGSNSFRPYVMGYKALLVMPLYIKDGFMRVTTAVPSDGDAFDPKNEDLADNLMFSNAIFYKYSEVRGTASVEPASQADLMPYYINSSDPTEMVMTLYANGINYIYIIDKD